MYENEKHKRTPGSRPYAHYNTVKITTLYTILIIY